MSGETHEAVHRHERPQASFVSTSSAWITKSSASSTSLALAAVLVGMTMSVLMRMNLSWPVRTADPGNVFRPARQAAL